MQDAPERVVTQRQAGLRPWRRPKGEATDPELRGRMERPSLEDSSSVRKGVYEACEMHYTK